MKQLKNLFFFLVLCAPLTAAGQNIEINAENFPDEIFRNYLLSRDYGADGVLTEAEIEGITSISISNKYISNLKGIEHFTALTRLYCDYNLLTELDMSKNTALTELRCYGNLLTELDVSKNTALTDLRCNGNQLTALDVSNNPALTYLDCYENQLTALDVSKNAELTDLQCYNNQLTALDVSNNQALRTLHLGSNQLTSLDVSNNTALRDLLCYSNPLMTLDVSKNTALVHLYCYNNQLTSLDVSNNPALGTLDCDRNYLTSLDVSNNPVLFQLYCHLNQIKGEAMDALISSLPETTMGYLYVYSEYLDYPEGNIITKSQVAAAQVKGWVSYITTNGWWWSEYEGMDDEAASIALPEAENSSAAVYTLQGQRVTAPQRGGIYIVGGRKVVFK